MPAADQDALPVPRRAVLGSLAAGTLMVLGGCRGSPARPTGAHRSPTPRGVTPDVGVAITAYGRISQTAALLDRTAARHPHLRRRLSGLTALHAAHLRLLRDAVPSEHRHALTGGQAPPSPVPRRPSAALQTALAAERDLRAPLEDLAVRADSGQFARLLAAMSAAIGQQLAVESG